jgi:hypothetical protein
MNGIQFGIIKYGGMLLLGVIAAVTLVLIMEPREFASLRRELLGYVGALHKVR